MPGLSIEKIKGFVEGYGYLAPVVFILICMGKPALFFIPSLGLSVIAGTVFGPVYGTLYVAIGGTGSAVVGFYVARFFGKNSVEHIVRNSKSLINLNEKMENKGFSTVLVLRLFNIPWDIVSYSAGLSKIKFKDFFVASLLMVLPISFIYTYFGSTVTRPMSKEFLISLSVIIGLSIVPYLYKKSRSNKNIQLHHQNDQQVDGVTAAAATTTNQGRL